MTLIAFSTNKNRADILTDTWSYSFGGRYIGADSKVHSIPHLDMAHATQGSTEFEALWNFGAIRLAMHVGSFDGFVQEAGPNLREVWSHVAERYRVPSVVFVLGYSPEDSRFRAYQFASSSDFERQDVEAPFIIPAPLDIRPSELEFARIKGSFTGSSTSAEMLAFVEDWHQKPGLVAPTTVKGWVQLGKRARETRAMAPAGTGLKVFVAGDLFHAVLKRGEFTTSRVHRFNDSGEEFAQLVSGTINPVSQYGPCPFCYSGRPYVDCCLAPYATEACPCESGKPFQACCSVRAETASTTVGNPTVDRPASTLADAVSVTS
jgi:SEC-C motif